MHRSASLQQVLSPVMEVARLAVAIHVFLVGLRLHALSA
jgi:hypothetical protein